MILPDYSGAGISNLMATISGALGAPGDTPYPPLQGVDQQPFQQCRNLILLVIDGFGEHYLRQRAGHSSLAQQQLARLTSVCPSTTASAIPTFLTGLPPQQHGFTGWFSYFQELGSVLTVLPMRTRLGSLEIPESVVTAAQLCGLPPLSERIPVNSHLLMPEWIAHSSFNRSFRGRSRTWPFNGLEGLSQAICQAAGSGPGRNYIYAYWPEFDALAHKYGVDSRQVEAHFQQLDALFDELQQQLAGSDSLLLVTADHGFIDTTPERQLQLQQHPQLAESLLVPLCGEPRLAFCYVHPHRQQQFERYVSEQLAGQVDLLRSEQLLADGWFGRGPAHPRLHQRIGHYALVMRENYCISGQLPGERPLRQIGVHGGVSAEEMYVPLISAMC